MDTAVCTECGRTTPFTDSGGRCEVNLGWLCNECIEKLTSDSVELGFQDEELEG